MVPNMQNGETDERRHDRPLDEDSGKVHERPASSLAGSTGLDLGAGEEAQLAVGDDRLSGRDPFIDDHLLAESAAGRDRPDLDVVIRLHHVDELPLLSGLHGFGGNDGSVLDGVERQHHGDELAGPEHAVFVVERRL